MIEASRHRAGNRDQVLVAPVTGTREHDDALPGHVETLREVCHDRHGVRVVPVIEEHLEGMLVEHVHATRRLEERGVEGAQALPDRVELDAEREGDRRGEHRILHVVGRAPLERRRDQMRPHERDVAATVVQRHHLAVHPRFERAGPAARPDVLADEGVLRIHGDVADVLRLGVSGHAEHERVVGVQHRAVGRHLDDDPLHFGQLLERVDALQPQVVGLHVQHRADVHLVHAHARPQQTAARGLEHGDVDLRIREHHARRDRTRHVALHRALTVDVHAVGRGEPGRAARHLRDVREHARRGRLAIRASDRRDRHAGRGTRREQHVDDGPGHVARRPLARRHVHAESRCRVHLADAATDRAVALGDVRRQEVDATDVEADRAHGAHRHVAVVGVDDVGDVGRRAARREVRGGAQVYDLARNRHRAGRHADPLEHAVRLCIEIEAREHLLMADAAARILVHDLDEIGDGVHAVARDVAGRAPGRRDELAVDDQQAMIVALEEGLDDHRARVFPSRREALHDLRVARQADRNAAAVITVVGLGNHRVADAARGAHRLRVALHQFLPRHRQAERGEDLVRFLLVAREFDGDVRRAPRHRRLYALLVASVAELHERLVVEPEPGNAPCLGCADQRRGGGPERPALREAYELVARFGPAPALGHAVRGTQRRGKQRAQEPQSELARGDPLVALGVLVDDHVQAGSAGAARLAEGDALARHVLQLDRDVLEHVAEPGALVLAHAPQETTRFAVGAPVLREARQCLGEGIDELAA